MKVPRCSPLQSRSALVILSMAMAARPYGDQGEEKNGANKVIPFLDLQSLINIGFGPR